jgi:citrate lyase beta subunit
VRSLLYTPGDQEDRIAENVKSGADAPFIDIEEPRSRAPKQRAKGAGPCAFASHGARRSGAPIYFAACNLSRRA